MSELTLYSLERRIETVKMTENDIVFEGCQFCFSKMSLTTYL